MPQIRLVVLAVSKKIGNYCVAGKTWHQNQIPTWTRPVGNSLPNGNDALTFKEIQYSDHRLAKPLDVIDLTLRSSANHPVQAENHSIDPSFKWVKAGSFRTSDLEKLVDNPATLWEVNHAGYHSPYCHNDRFPISLITQPIQSLYLIKVEELKIHLSHEYDNFKGCDRKRYRGEFYYRNIRYKFSITDPSIYTEYGQQPDGEYNVTDCYLTISMAPLASNGNCFKFIAAIFK